GALRVPGPADLVLVRGPELAVAPAVEDRYETQALERGRIVVERAVRSDDVQLPIPVQVTERDRVRVLGRGVELPRRLEARRRARCARGAGRADDEER